MNKFEIKKRVEVWAKEKFDFNVFEHNKMTDCVFYRQNIMFALKKITTQSLKDIGFICGNGKAFNHSTVFCAIKTVKNEMDIYIDRKKSVEEIIESIGIVLNEPYVKNNDELELLMRRIEENLRMNYVELTIWNIIKYKARQ